MFKTAGVQTDSIDEVLSKLNETKVWEYLLDIEITLGKKLLSPLREEKDPSAVFFISSQGSTLLQDFVLGTYSISRYLKEIRGMTSLEALEMLKRLLDDSKYHSEARGLKTGSNELRDTKIFIKKDSWKETELAYFKEYHITQSILDILHVFPISKYWVKNSKGIFEFKRKKNELLFAFNPKLDKYKIYRPESKGTDKWYGNINKNVLFGWESLPQSADNLIITKGIKELSILRILGYNSIAIQAEKNYPSDRIIKMLEQRFEKIYVLMDIDKTGLEASKYFVDRYKFKEIIILSWSSEFIIKDLADYCKLEGLEGTDRLIKEQL